MFSSTIFTSTASTSCSCLTRHPYISPYFLANTSECFIVVRYSYAYYMPRVGLTRQLNLHGTNRQHLEFSSLTPTLRTTFSFVFHMNRPRLLQISECIKCVASMLPRPWISRLGQSIPPNLKGLEDLCHFKKSGM